MAWSKEKQRAYYDKWKLANRDKLRANYARWCKRNPEKLKAHTEKYAHLSATYSKAYRERNPQRRAATTARYRATHKAEDRAYRQSRQVIQRPFVAARAAKRRAAKRNATPAWADMKAISVIYETCQRISALSGTPHDVDHFYPLQSRKVCGLHCDANLRIITSAENVAKGNKFPA